MQNHGGGEKLSKKPSKMWSIDITCSTKTTRITKCNGFEAIPLASLAPLDQQCFPGVFRVDILVHTYFTNLNF